MGELLDHMARITIETLCTDVFIAASDQDQALLVEEFDAIHHRVERLAVRCCVPIVLNDWSFQVAEVPKLHTLSKSATTRHHILVVVADVDSVSAN